MKIIRNNFIPVKGFKAINLFGVLFVRGNAVINEKTLRHEYIHTMQMCEMLYVPFYLWYGIEYVIRFIGWSFEKKNPYYPNDKPYDRMSFEREAYGNEHDVNSYGHMACRSGNMDSSSRSSMRKADNVLNAIPQVKRHIQHFAHLHRVDVLVS